MSIEGWPKWLRWLLFVPAAVAAMSAMHFVLTLALRGDQLSVAGIGMESRWLSAVWREGIMRFLEPWAFVAAGGAVAPAKKVPVVVLASVIGLLFLAILALQISRGISISEWLGGIIGVAGAVAGAVTAIRNSSENRQVRT